MNAADFPEAKLEEVRGVSNTEYRITGELQQVLASIEGLFKRYHPFGYGTRVHAIECVYPTTTYSARMSRANSCD